MADLARREVPALGAGAAAVALSQLMALVGEAVVVFDATGEVLLANDRADELFAHDRDGLVGTDVRLVFPPAAADASPAFSLNDLPFDVDGSPRQVTVRGAGGSAVTVRVRAEHVNAPGGAVLLVARPQDQAVLEALEVDGRVRELERANHRLSGALGIVLETLDSENVTTLFDRVLDEISSTMDADGTIIYLAEPDGFHLRGTSGSLDGAAVPQFMAFGRAIETLASRAGHGLRLRVQQASGQDLRRGRLQMRDVLDEDTRDTHRVEARLLPPFTSFIATPVWFGGHVISIIEVGWRRARALRTDDVRLLDSVAHYLSMQLMGAFAAMRAERARKLESLATELRERLMSATDGPGDGAVEILESLWPRVAAGVGAVAAIVEENTHQHLVMAGLPGMGQRSMPFDLDELVEGHAEGEVAVVPIGPSDEVHEWLSGLNEPCVGAFVDAGTLVGARRSCLMLRPDGAEPFDDAELAFLLRFAQDVRDIARGEEAREREARISQALQTGMRNELQHVDGLTAQGIYSSATAAAFVGGDFYDLIRLPDRRACVIMGDVSGKGVEAASVSAAVKTALGAYAWEGLEPARMVRLLNDFILGFSRLETFVTLFVGIVDLAEGTLAYCSAGHPPAVLAHGASGEMEMLDVQSGVVGAFHGIAYRDGRVVLSPGDVLLLYTDGTTEARRPDGAFFGEEGLRDAIMREQGKPFEGFLDRMLATLDEFTGHHLEDDVAMVALRVDEVG